MPRTRKTHSTDVKVRVPAHGKEIHPQREQSRIQNIKRGAEQPTIESIAEEQLRQLFKEWGLKSGVRSGLWAI